MLKLNDYSMLTVSMIGAALPAGTACYCFLILLLALTHIPRSKSAQLYMGASNHRAFGSSLQNWCLRVQFRKPSLELLGVTVVSSFVSTGAAPS